MASQFHIFDLEGNDIERFHLPQYKDFDLRSMNEDKFVGFAMAPGGENAKENKVLSIFDTEGILLNRVPFPPGMERFDNWSLFNDRFFFADPYGQACVYVYQAVWK